MKTLKATCWDKLKKLVSAQYTVVLVREMNGFHTVVIDENKRYRALELDAAIWAAYADLISESN